MSIELLTILIIPFFLKGCSTDPCDPLRYNYNDCKQSKKCTKEELKTVGTQGRWWEKCQANKSTSKSVQKKQSYRPQFQESYTAYENSYTG